MPKPLQSSAILTLLTSFLAFSSTSCSRVAVSNPNFEKATVSEQANSDRANTATITSETALSPPPGNKAAANKASESVSPQLDFYHLAVQRASSAVTISQSAQSRDDWHLVANRWQEAIDLMKAVPVSSSHRSQSGRKLSEYRRNLTYAQQQATRPTLNPNPDGIVVLSSPVVAPKGNSSTPIASLSSPQASLEPPALSNDGVFYAPIVRRAGSTPVISVTFNGNQKFDMILDTGASGTLITRRMADSLSVIPIAEASVDTASERAVSFPLGYVNSIQVGGAVADHVLVAVAGPELNVGLLGHDFFGNYDVTIRQDQVEFRER